MSENSYSLVHDQQHKVVIMSREYLNKNSEKTKELLLKYGACQKCGAVQSDFNTCSCELDLVQNNDVWATTIANENWEIVKPFLEKDRLSILSASRSAIREKNLKYCPGFHLGEDIDQIRLIQGNTCYFCEIDLSGIKTQIDHLNSVTNEGSEWPSNLAITCVDCNTSKSSMNESEYWKVQRTKLTPEHFRILSTKRRTEKMLKKKLDATRIKEIKKRIMYLQAAVNAAITSSKSVDINIEYIDTGIVIRSGNFELTTLPHAHREFMMMKPDKIKNWAITLTKLHLLLES